VTILANKLLRRGWDRGEEAGRRGRFRKGADLERLETDDLVLDIKDPPS